MKYEIGRGSLVVTSISGPNAVLKALADGAREREMRFIVVGDSKSPKDFSLPGCDFFSLDRQRQLPFAYAKLCPERSYTRKNIGYLLALGAGAQFVVETDDDNFPESAFWGARDENVSGDLVSREGWLNVYRYFSGTSIYPRGFPLELVANSSINLPSGESVVNLYCPIQQGLADRNPDVDAIYRMFFPLPLDFDKRAPVILDRQTWCPFNSQNTTTFRNAAALLYLPAFCSFRMTDIWRSFVAQRIAWTCGWRISFHASTVHQERNVHDLLRDFADEVPGYLHNAQIARELDALELTAKTSAIESNMRACYAKLIFLGVVNQCELELLDAWFTDLSSILV